MILATGGEGIDGIDVKHTIKKGKKIIIHKGFKKIVVDEDFDANREDWHQYLQEKYKDQLV